MELSSALEERFSADKSGGGIHGERCWERRLEDWGEDCGGPSGCWTEPADLVLQVTETH